MAVDGVDEGKRTGDWKNHLEKIALHAKSNCKTRSGLLVIRPGQLTVPQNAQAAELRCEYFKADRLIKCLAPQGEEADKKRPKFLDSVVDEQEANLVATALLEMKESGTPKYLCQTLKPEKRKGDAPDVLFLGTSKGEIPGRWDEVIVGAGKGEKGEATTYYVWLWEGDQTMSNFMTGGIVTAFLLITCFPIWPQIMKVILWYISCTLLVLIFSLVIIRWFLFLFVWIFGFEFWILPNLFDEERSVMDSFKPFISFEKTGPGQLWWRMAVLVAFIGSTYWAYTQPTEFDEFLKSNGQFVDDLYAGTLLSDMSQWSKENIDNPYKVPTIDELLSDMESENQAYEQAQGEVRMENENFLDGFEEDKEEDVDALFDSLFDEEE